MNKRPSSPVFDEERPQPHVTEIRAERDYRIGLTLEKYLEKVFQRVDPKATVTPHQVETDKCIECYVQVTFEHTPSIAKATKVAEYGLKRYFGLIHDYFEVNPMTGGYEIKFLELPLKKPDRKA